MNDAIALEVNGIFRNINEMILCDGKLDEKTRAATSHSYPHGQAIRGAFGYLFLDLGSELAKTYGEEHNVLYFKDALPHHFTDGGILHPKIVENKYISYECQKCKQLLRHPTYKSMITKIRQDRNINAVSQMFRLEAITKSTDFRFKLILNLKIGKQYTADLLAILDYIKENGLSLGKRSMKGQGKLIISNLNHKIITMEDINKRAEELKSEQLSIKLLSNAIVKEADWNQNKIEPEAFLRSVKNASKFFNPEYKNYINPEIKLINYSTLRPIPTTFLDCKKGKANLAQEYAISKGSIFTYTIQNASIEFYQALAIAEQCTGIGKRTSFGKGEFTAI